jgi:hypothetical protein
MKRYLASMSVIAMAACGLVAALATQPVIAADDPVIQADRAVTAALSKGDKAAAEKYLDADFTWIDDMGVYRVKEDAFRAGIKPLIPDSPDVKYIEHKYGNVIWLQANAGKNYTARFWVKRGSAWKLLHTSELSVHDRDYKTVRPDYVVPCINPCEAVPYTPVTANEKAALAGWQEQESGREGMWAKHIADNFDRRAASTVGGPRQTKSEMVAAQDRGRQINAGRPEVATVPALMIRTWDFGTAVVMIACQPNYGDKAYWASRVFAPLNGVWMMMESYHNTIDASPVMTAVPLEESKDPRGLKMVTQK